MKRLLLFTLLLPGAAWAQASWWERARAAGESAVASVRAQGAPAWRRLVRAAEWRIARLEREYGSLRIEERRRLATELWRMRSALDLTAGLDDSTVRGLTGIDPRELRRLRKRLVALVPARPKA